MRADASVQCADLTLYSIYPTTIPISGGPLQLSGVGLGQPYINASCLIGGSPVAGNSSGPQSITCQARGSRSIMLLKHCTRFSIDPPPHASASLLPAMG